MAESNNEDVAEMLAYVNGNDESEIIQADENLNTDSMVGEVSEIGVTDASDTVDVPDEMPDVVGATDVADTESVNELDELKKQNAALLKLIEDLHAGPGIQKFVKDSAAVQGTTVTTEVTPEKAMVESGFVTPDDFDLVLSDSAKFNAVLASVAKRANEETTARILQVLPQIVMSAARAQSVFDTAAKDFYTTNADLVNVKSTVGRVAETVGAEHSDWTLEAILSETAKRTRAMLGLNTTKKRNPAIPKIGTNKGRGVIVPKKMSVQDMIAELMSV